MGPGGNTAPSLPLAPPLVFLDDLAPRTAFAINQPPLEAVFLQHVVLRDDELKVPGRVAGLRLAVVAAAAGRVREANALAPVEHHDQYVLAEQPVEERQVKLQGRQ